MNTVAESTSAGESADRARIVTVPTATADTFPFPSTVASVSSELDHTTPELFELLACSP